MEQNFKQWLKEQDFASMQVSRAGVDWFIEFFESASLSDKSILACNILLRKCQNTEEPQSVELILRGVETSDEFKSVTNDMNIFGRCLVINSMIHTICEILVEDTLPSLVECEDYDSDQIDDIREKATYVMRRILDKTRTSNLRKATAQHINQMQLELTPFSLFLDRTIRSNDSEWKAVQDKEMTNALERQKVLPGIIQNIASEKSNTMIPLLLMRKMHAALLAANKEYAEDIMDAFIEYLGLYMGLKNAELSLQLWDPEIPFKKKDQKPGLQCKNDFIEEAQMRMISLLKDKWSYIRPSNDGSSRHTTPTSS